MQGAIMHEIPSAQARQGFPRKVFFWSEALILFAGIGFSSALLIHDYSAVKARRDVLQQYEGNSQFRCIRRDDPAYPVASRTPDVSWFRRTMGDKAVTLIFLPRTTTNDDELSRVRVAFPEAKVERFPMSRHERE